MLSRPKGLRVSMTHGRRSFSFLCTRRLSVLHYVNAIAFFGPRRSQTVPRRASLLCLPNNCPRGHLRRLTKTELTERSVHDCVRTNNEALTRYKKVVCLSRSILSSKSASKKNDSASKEDAKGDMDGIKGRVIKMLPFDVAGRHGHEGLALKCHQFSCGK